MTMHVLDRPQRIDRWLRRIWRMTRLARFDNQFVVASRNVHHFECAHLTQLGWQALQRNDQQAAQLFFRAALYREPYGTNAWVGLSRCVDDLEERRVYLQAAIDLQYLVGQMRRNCRS